METSCSVFPFVSASPNLSASIIYYGLEGVILWGSITVQSVPSSEGGGGEDGAGFDGPQVTSCLRVCQHLWLGSSVVSRLKPDVRQRLPFPHWLSLSYWGQGGIPSFWSRSPECQARSGCVSSGMYTPLSQHCNPCHRGTRGACSG